MKEGSTNLRRSRWLLILIFALKINSSAVAFQMSARPDSALSELETSLKNGEASLEAHGGFFQGFNETDFVPPMYRFINSRLSDGESLEKLDSELNEAMQTSLSKMWGDSKAANVLPCGRHNSSRVLITFRVGSGTGNRTFLELYRKRGQRYYLTAKTSIDLDTFDTRVIQLSCAPAYLDILVYGKNIGSGSNISHAMLYRASGTHIFCRWTMKTTLQLAVKKSRRSILMTYVDADRFYKVRLPPFHFRDTYLYSGGHLRRTRHTALPDAQQ